jgi:hypothetical protein
VQQRISRDGRRSPGLLSLPVPFAAFAVIERSTEFLGRQSVSSSGVHGSANGLETGVGVVVMAAVWPRVLDGSGVDTSCVL